MFRTLGEHINSWFGWFCHPGRSLNSFYYHHMGFTRKATFWVFWYQFVQTHFPSQMIFEDLLVLQVKGHYPHNPLEVNDWKKIIRMHF